MVLFTTAQLHDRGYSTRAIAKLVDAGVLVRIRRGLYTPDTESNITAAIRRGARVGCLSGCHLYGLWVPHDRDVHVVYGGGRKPTARPNTQIHRSSRRLPSEPIWPLEDCIAQVIQNHDSETGLIVLESAVNNGKISHHQALVQLETGNRRVQRLAPYLNNSSQSGSETRLRYFFERRGIRVRAQVTIPGLGQVDLLVGENLIVECDSNAHHSDQAAYENDRRRDLVAWDLGYRTLRLSYRQIWDDWESTQLSILALIRQNVHRKRAS